MLKASRRSCWSFAALSGCTLGFGSVHAIDPDTFLSIQAGPVVIQPTVGVAESYNDNIYYRPSKPVPGFINAEPEDDFVSIFSPGVSFQLGRDEASYLRLEYGMTGMLYASHDAENSDDHSFGLTARYSGAKLTVTGGDRLSLLSSIYGGSSTLGIRLNRYTLNDGYTVNYQMTEKTAVYAGGMHDRTDFEKGVPLYDSSTLRGTGGFGYQWSPKLSLFGESYYGQSATTPNHALLRKGPYSWFMGGFLGVRGEFTAKLSGILKLGYEARGYGDGASSPGGPVVDATLSHRFSEKTLASLEYVRRSYASIQFSRYSYVRDGVILRLNQMLGNTGRLSASADARFEFDSYDPLPGVADRLDQRMRIGAGLAYQIKLWMTASLNYEFEKFTSGVQTSIDYDVNRITVQLSVGY
jgi:hypothetical protein